MKAKSRSVLEEEAVTLYFDILLPVLINRGSRGVDSKRY